MTQSMPDKPALDVNAAGAGAPGGDEVAAWIDHQRRRTFTPRVLADRALRQGCIRLDYGEKLFQRNYRDPVLVSGAAGSAANAPGAALLRAYDLIGPDCVAGAVNDLVSRGA